MKNIRRIISALLISTLLFSVSLITSFADDIAKTHFMVFLKEEYCHRVQEVIDSIDCEYLGEVRELTNPEDYDSAYTPMLLVWVKDKNEAFFDEAQEYFLDKDYCYKTICDVLIGAGDADFDGRHTAEDARFILRCAVGLEQYVSLIQCDANADGAVTADDARLVLRYSVGLY